MANNKITKLTPEQESRLTEFRDKWLKIGLCTKRCDRPKAEDALRRVYQVAGLPPPASILWVNSPLAGAYLLAILRDEKIMGSIFAELKVSAPKAPGDQVWDQVRAQVWGQVRNQVRDQVRAQVWAQVWDQVRAQVWAQVRNQVWAQVGAQVWAQVGDQVGNALYGQHDANWLGFYEYFREVCSLAEVTAKLIPLTDLALESNWIYPYQNVAVISEKPTEVHMNSRGRTHRDLGPSVLYADGFSVYSLDGVRMPEWVVMTPAEKLDVTEILKLPNAEQRLLAIKKFGAHNMLEQLGGKSISKKGDEYELFEVNLEGEKEKLLKMKNPSEERWHFEWVTPEIKTVNEALAYRRNLKSFVEPVFKT